jgi:hypothetical protein
LRGATILSELRGPRTYVIGLDVPLEWPTCVAEMLVAHQDHQPIDAGGWIEFYDVMRIRSTITGFAAASARTISIS